MATINKNQQQLNLKSSLNILFYVSKIFGIITYSWNEYYNSRIFKVSVIGLIYSIFNLVHNSVQYHFATIQFSLGNESEAGTLTIIIGIFIIYMEPIMMCVDIIASIINQKHLIHCLDRMQKVDDKLLKENITIDYIKLKRFSIRLIILITICELTLVCFNFLQFQDVTAIESLYWFVTFLPMYLSTLSKIWFIILVYNVKQKFIAINDYFNNTRIIFYERKCKLRKNNPSDRFATQSNNNNKIINNVINSKILEEIEHVGYLHKEMYPKHLIKRTAKLQKRAFEFPSKTKTNNIDILHVRPIDNPKKDNEKYFYNDKNLSESPTPPLTPPQSPSFTPPPAYFNVDEFLPFTDKKLVIDDKMDKKITLLCHLHDEICEIGKIINQMFSFQMLLLMAYGFMCLTAQFYFVYCGLVKQTIPELFRSAEDLRISTFYIIYTGAKCVFVIYMSWQTKIDAQKTGIQLHKVANVIDEDHFYQTVNHLSLKLLNHQLNFTACGFFDLDMTTLYAITGAITSYLIILIQFNLAAQRNRKTGNSISVNKNNTLFNSTIIPN